MTITTLREVGALLEGLPAAGPAMVANGGMMHDSLTQGGMTFMMVSHGIIFALITVALVLAIAALIRHLWTDKAPAADDGHGHPRTPVSERGARDA